jgi:hypothetical protein
MLRGPREIPAPPWMSIASLTTCRIASVDHAFAIAEITAGFPPASTAPAVSQRIALSQYVVPAMRESGASMPSKRPIARPNCSRTDA